MTAITSYATLKSNVIEYGKRNDALGMVDVFLDLCEADIARVLRVPEMDATATATTSTSVKYVAFPTRFLEMRQILLTLDGVQYEMDATNLNDMRILDSAGVPTEYAITSRIEFNRVSDQAYTVTYQYYQNPSPLDGTNTTHAVLTTYPMIYLAGCLHHLSNWAKDGATSIFWLNYFNSEVAKANWDANNKRYPAGLSSKYHGGMIV